MAKITERFIGFGLSNNPNAYLDQNKPLGIIAHQTGTYHPGSNAEAFHNALKNDNTEVSWHATADDKEVIQSFADNRRLWHAGNTWANSNLMAIEMCVHNKNNKEAYINTLKNGAAFIASKMIKYGWDISKVHKHSEYANTSCPAELSAGLHGVTWSDFLKMIRDEVSKQKGTTTTNNTASISKKAAAEIGNKGAKYWDEPEDWCADFVSYVLQGVMPYTDECADIVKWGELKGYLYLKDTNNKYYKGKKLDKIKAEDILLFDFEPNGYANHVAIVENNNAGSVGYIDGNGGGADIHSAVVARRTINENDARIMGVVRIGTDSGKGTDTESAQFNIPVAIQGYMSVEDLKAKRNGKTYAAGTYYIYKKYEDYLNISKTKGQPGAWVSLKTEPINEAYRVQVGYFNQKANADAMAAELQKKGYQTIVKKETK